MVTHDGTLLQYGDPLEMWPSIELRPVVHHYPTQSCAASSIGSFLVSQSRLFTWPLIGEEVQILEPVEVRINARVKNVAAGNQFAVMLCENGLLYSWGENLEGELGLGDTHVR
jgi:myosin-5